jgi:hypothetical protein
MDSSLQALLAKVEHDKIELNAARPLPAHTVASLREAVARMDLSLTSSPA